MIKRYNSQELFGIPNNFMQYMGDITENPLGNRGFRSYSVNRITSKLTFKYEIFYLDLDLN